MIDKNTLKTVNKVRRLASAYESYLYCEKARLVCEICEIPAPDTLEEKARFRSEVPDEGWRGVSFGEEWGGDYVYAWFRAVYTVGSETAGKRLYLISGLGEAEGLLFINGKPSGLFDYCPEIPGNSARLHKAQPLTDGAAEGEKFSLAVEAYSGHTLYGTMPYENEHNNPGNFYPVNTRRVYNGLIVAERDDIVDEFLKNHRILFQLLDTAGSDTLEYAEAVKTACRVFAVVPQFPSEEESAVLHPSLLKAVEIMKELTCRKWESGRSLGYIGVIGHSHLDTAWQWPVRETLHKAARTFSNALRVMEHNPEYKFIQSSVVYIDWMKKYYPDIFESIKRRTAEGRWEPNGGAWVECDNNMPGGEYIIRTFLRGQLYTKENLGYTADSFWQPDTFGYSASIPQILRGCGIKNFLTTKLSWNESNRFPYDSFIWRGIDGSEVLTHFNLTHCWPDIKTVRENALPSIRHKDASDMKLLAYGFGDGGGGPSYDMAESAARIRDMAGLPEIETVTVSRFMEKLSERADELPVYSGELYLELHRGTLTQMHDIKRSNRMLEKEIHNFELLGVITGNRDMSAARAALDTLLINQFHDILPGTCIGEVNDVAVHQNYQSVSALKNTAEGWFHGGKEGITVFNPLSWERKDQLILNETGFTPKGYVCQKYTDTEGTEKLAVGGVKIPSLSLLSLSDGEPVTAESPFIVSGDMISTPFADIIFKNGTIVSYITKSGFEAVRDSRRPFNTLYYGEDIPDIWDNWDIDYDQRFKMHPVTECESSKIVSCGALQLRIRVVKKLDRFSKITQDIVFYADNPRIDFETAVDWHTPHRLLKAGFDAAVMSDTARYEMQFGYVKRPTHENYSTDKTQFEVCNHKWTDLSDSRFGVSLLNDCKYGISVSGSDMRLTLHKGGCRPDISGDEGHHIFTYSLLVHESGFGTASVIRPAYELNYPVCAYRGAGISRSPLFTADSENVIIETVKFSEDSEGVILRLYETEGSRAVCKIKTSLNAAMAFVTDMLEQPEKELELENGEFLLQFRPFEIKTVKLI